MTSMARASLHNQISGCSFRYVRWDWRPLLKSLLKYFERYEKSAQRLLQSGTDIFIGWSLIGVAIGLMTHEDDNEYDGSFWVCSSWNIWRQIRIVQLWYMDLECSFGSWTDCWEKEKIWFFESGFVDFYTRLKGKLPQRFFLQKCRKIVICWEQSENVENLTQSLAALWGPICTKTIRTAEYLKTQSVRRKKLLRTNWRCGSC